MKKKQWKSKEIQSTQNTSWSEDQDLGSDPSNTKQKKIQIMVKVGSEIKIAKPTIGPTQQTGGLYTFISCGSKDLSAETTEKYQQLSQTDSSPGRHNPHLIHESSLTGQCPSWQSSIW